MIRSSRAPRPSPSPRWLGPLRSTAVALLALASLAAAGCGNPCDELADLTCQAGGEGSQECLSVRDKAAKASSEDKEACGQALTLVGNLERKN
jgi:hypothetical protein